MNLYIKPSAMFITASGTAGMGVSCSTSREDIDLIKEILGITDWANAFSINESCQQQYDLENYCKFTSVEDGSMKILTS